MSIEPIVEVDLDTYPDEATLLAQASTLESQRLSVVSLTASLESWEKLTSFLCALRSANISPILQIRRGEELLEDEEILYVFSFLRSWDQFLLGNFMEICGEWVPALYQPLLQIEAKTELKWFKEWSLAASDPRIHKYPGLPWRSFMRKINTENHRFAAQFLELTANAATPENLKIMDTHIRAFLEAKKKVVCVFPKRWSRPSAETRPLP